MLRAIHKSIVIQQHWDTFFNLPEDVLVELRFWLQSFHKLNSRYFVRSLEYTRVVYSDASDIGAGGYSVQYNDKVSHLFWSDSEKTMSSTWRELRAVLSVLVSLVDILRDQTVKWYSDNQSVIAIVDHGSGKAHLQSLALQIYHFSVLHNVKI